MKHKNIDGSELTFERDSKISFEPSTHTYCVEGLGLMTPVSTIIDQFFNPFDKEGISLRKSYGDAIAAAKLREEWEYAGALSSQAGTHLHLQIENFINEGKEPDLQCTISYEGNYIKTQTQVDISKEWQFFQQFAADVHFQPFRTEWCVFDEEIRMAGTIDLLCRCNDGSFEIFDWKRSKGIIPNEQSKYRMNMLHGLEYVPDTTYYHYCLQQNLYRHMLEKNYGLHISRMHLVVLHPDFQNYALISLPRMEKEVEIIYQYCRTHPLLP